MITIENVTVEYRAGADTVTPLRAFSAALDATGTALTGPSGSGKSTLLRVVAGLQQPTSGQVTIGGQPVDGSRGAIDRRVAFVYQDYRLVEFLDVRDNLRLACELRGLPPSEDEIAEALDLVGMPGFERRRPATLSGGEQQRVAIARAVLCGPEVLLADEPTGALDPDNSRHVAELLAGLGERAGLQVVVATHDPLVAERMAAEVRLRHHRGRSEEA